MNITDQIESMKSELRFVFVAMLLTVGAAIALLLWGIVSSQGYVVVLGAAVALVAAGGWSLERAGVKQTMRWMA